MCELRKYPPTTNYKDYTLNLKHVGASGCYYIYEIGWDQALDTNPYNFIKDLDNLKYNYDTDYWWEYAYKLEEGEEFPLLADFKVLNNNKESIEKYLRYKILDGGE